MHIDSLSSHNMTENDILNMPTDMAGQNPVAADRIFPHTTPVSLTHFNSLDLNNQNQLMAGFPGFSMLQDEPINNIHTGHHLANYGISGSDALFPRNTQRARNAIRDASIGSSGPISSIEFQDRFVSGMPVSASSLAALLAARCRPHENLNDLATSAPSAYPVEILKTFVSNDYSALNSSIGTSANCGYEGVLDDMNSKWDFSNFLAPPELPGTVPVRAGFQPFQLMPNMDSSGWISSENASVSSDSPSGSSRFSNELSLSLSTCQPTVICGTTIRDQCLEMSGSVGTRNSLNERLLGSEQTSHDSKNLSLSFGSYKPVQFSELLSGSRYLHVMQEILTEITSYSLENLDQMIYPACGIGAGANVSFSSSHPGRGYTSMDSDDFPDGDGRFDVQMDPVLRGRVIEAKKKHLLALLQVVDDRYNQCLDEIHTVISAFHAVTELDPHIHARFALQTISFLYKNLRERISNHILAMGELFGKGSAREEESTFETSFIQKQWALQQLRRKDHQLWRPQRGLPERSVSVLRAWMFQNFLHPYPKDAEKHLLAVKSGLTRSQVSNWFINARVRLWKPMIEEMYSDINRRKARQNEEEIDSNSRNHGGIESNSRNHICIDTRRFKVN